MKRLNQQKILVFSIIFLFSIPILTSFCCCQEMPWQKHSQCDEPSSHHGHHEHQGVSHHHDAKSDCDHHDHSKCNHPSLISDLTSAKSYSISLISSLLEFHRLIEKSGDLFSKVDGHQKDSPPYFDTGPPGFHLHSTPLYLQISVLRI